MLSSVSVSVGGDLKAFHSVNDVLGEDAVFGDGTVVPLVVRSQRILFAALFWASWWCHLVSVGSGSRYPWWRGWRDGAPRRIP